MLNFKKMADVEPLRSNVVEGALVVDNDVLVDAHRYTRTVMYTVGPTMMRSRVTSDRLSRAGEGRNKGLEGEFGRARGSWRCD